MRKPEKMGSFDGWLLGTVAVLVALGLLLVFDASYKKAVECNWANNDPWFYVKKQMIFAGVGLIGMFIAMQMRLKTLLRLTMPVFVVSVILLFAVLIVGAEKYGARRWFECGGKFSFQPSEMAKIGLVFYLSALLAQRKAMVRRLNSHWFVPLGLVGLTAGLVVVEPDLGTAIVIIGSAYIMFFAAGALKRHLVVAGATMASLVGLAIWHSPERMERVWTWLDPWRDYYGEGYQIVHSLIAHGTGGVFGLGLCEGREKAYLPAASTDFIFATVAEEAGLIGGLVVLFVFMVLIYRGLDIARRSQNTYANLLAVGMTSVIGLQAAINIAVVSSAIPATGVPLPFMSYGGSSMLFMLVSVGILLSVSRQVDVKLDDRELYEHSFDGWRDGRAHLSGYQHRSSSSRATTRSRTALRR